MSREAYALPEGAPARFVWFHQCDVCGKAGAGPARRDRDLTLEALNAEGWRCLTSREQLARLRERLPAPWDTCPECLAEEEVDGNE